MKVRRLWLFIALLVIGSLALAACAAPAPAPAGEEAAPAEAAAPAAEAGEGGPMTIEFWGGWTGPDGDIMQSLVDQWNSENPDIQVNLTVQQWSPLFDAFIVSASAKESPDILAMHPQEMPQFVELGLLNPLDDIVAQSDVINADNYLPSAWDANIYKGALYGIPLDLHMHGLYYNKDLFEAAGIDAPPTTGDELLDVARKLTVDANGKHPGEDGFDPETVEQYGINMHTNHHAFFQWWSLYNQLGGKLISEDGASCVMDLDKAAQAWQFLQDLVYKEGVAPQGQTDYARDFLAGRTAMLIDGPWRMPALIAAHEESGFNWGSSVYPLVFDEPAVWGSSHMFTLPTYADPAKQEAAFKFLEWLAANSTAWANSGQLPAFKAVIESEEFKNMEGRAAFIEMMPYEKLFPNTPKYSEIFASNAPTPMMLMAQDIMLEQADPATEVQSACDTITGILSTP
jgi:multiple sugar transport system substrate-binding protein